MKEATAADPELLQVLKEKIAGNKSTKMSKGPYGKIWPEIHERDGILIRGDKIIVPKSLQAQAIAIAHEGHQQSDGTLRLLRESQWFRNMRKMVKEFVESCKCQAASPANPTTPQQLKTPYSIILFRSQ